MTRSHAANDAMRRGMAFMQATQLSNGSFDSFSSPAMSPFTPKRRYSTTFTPALILAAISHVDIESAHAIRSTLAEWLIAQKSPAWSFNYWAIDAPERRRLPYPDDLDDTFCALIALHRHDPSLVGEAALASAVKLLIAAESQVGGPYRTWLAAASMPKVWQDIDLAVNANVAGFLRLIADPLPGITRLMEQAIADRSFGSSYYPSAYPTMYYIARAYDGPLKNKLADHLISQRHDDWWGSLLPTALAITSLVRLGRADACQKAAERLLASQQSDGSWPAEAFCIDPAIQKKTYYSGAAALTTAFALEALACLYKTPPARTSTKRSSDTTANLLHRQITATAQKSTRHLEPELKQQVQAILKRTHAADSGREIALLPYFFHSSLVEPLSAARPELFVHLGAANTFGWAAYTIYDDFLDDEGDPQQLSAANTALRYSLHHFRQALPESVEFQAFAAKTFDVIDGANTWELMHCRMPVTDKTIAIGPLPRYANTLDLANRSMGHVLTPLAVLTAANTPPNDLRAAHVSLAFRHYITARQLNDDLHDWEQDLRAGIITYVVARLLQELAVPTGAHAFAKLVPKLQRQFWHHTLPAVCHIIARHTALARRAARACGLLVQSNIITQLTSKIDDSVTHTLAEQKKAQDFLVAYQSPGLLKVPQL